MGKASSYQQQGKVPLFTHVGSNPGRKGPEYQSQNWYESLIQVSLSLVSCYFWMPVLSILDMWRSTFSLWANYTERGANRDNPRSRKLKIQRGG